MDNKDEIWIWMNVDEMEHNVVYHSFARYYPPPPPPAPLDYYTVYWTQNSKTYRHLELTLLNSGVQAVEHKIGTNKKQLLFFL